MTIIGEHKKVWGNSMPLIPCFHRSFLRYAHRFLDPNNSYSVSFWHQRSRDSSCLKAPSVESKKKHFSTPKLTPRSEKIFKPLSKRIKQRIYRSPLKPPRCWLWVLAESRSISTLIGLTPWPPSGNFKGKRYRPIIYIDESGFAQDMPRLYGYSPKGKRCYGKNDWLAKVNGIKLKHVVGNTDVISILCFPPPYFESIYTLLALAINGEFRTVKKHPVDLSSQGVDGHLIQLNQSQSF